jgi:integrase
MNASYDAAMAQVKRRRRTRGNVEELPSGQLRVRVYAGIDPVTRKPHYLREIVGSHLEVDKALTRLLNPVDERRNPADVGHDEPAVRPVARGARRRGLHPPRLRQEAGRAHPPAARPVPGRPGRRRGAGVVLRPAAQVPGALRRPAVHPAPHPRPHDCDARCKPHKCRGLAPSTIRQIHWILSGALDRAVRWHWIAVNPADHADKPALPHPDPQPPSAADAARLVNAAWAADPDWGAFVWLAMTSGARRGELCALCWHHLDLAAGVITFRRALFQDDDGQWQEKDLKNHQQRRVVIDPETVAVLTELRDRRLATAAAAALGQQLPADTYVFSPEPDGSIPLNPDTATQRYGRMADRLKIGTHLQALRHYTATELITAGVDPRTVAGRLGHAGGGTTLRVYAAWVSEADQRAATTLAARMPPRPRSAQDAGRRHDA